MLETPAQKKRLPAKWHELDKSSKWIFLLLGVCTLAAWIYMALSGDGMAGMSMDLNAAEDSGMDAMMAQRAANSIAGVSLPPLAMFIPMWFAMCVAMMLPTAVSMILCMDKLARNRYGDVRRIPVLVILFVAGYLLVWIGFGIACWAIGYFAIFQWLYPYLVQPLILWLSLGVVFLAAGVYQNSPLKYACLRGCQHPLSFLTHHWRSGRFGALAMGIHHGVHCAGCCAALMIIMFPLGMMNLAWMGLFTMIMYVEKNAVFGSAVSKVIGWLLLIVGVLVTLISAGLLLFA